MSNRKKPAARPNIIVNTRQLREVTADALQALIRANVPPVVFKRGGLLVRVRVDHRTGPAIQVMNEPVLRHQLARVADWYRQIMSGLSPTPPPGSVVQDILALPDWPDIPPLKGLVEAPTFAQDGTLLTTPGYHPAAELWFHNAPGFVVPPVNPTPSPDEVKEAVQFLREELLGDFPFDSEASRANLLAAMLLPFVRDLTDGPTPLHLIDAPTPGTGKGLLAEVIAIPATGRSAEIMPEGRDEDEWRKRITSSLIRGPVMVVMDNVRLRLDSGSLAAALTAPIWTDRELGYSRMLVLPVRTVWIATGNNIATSHEIARRSVWIRLDSETPEPWTRTDFRHPDLRDWAKSNRAKLVHACLTLIQAWIAAGRPESGKVLGSYEPWAKIIGGILMVAGVPGFLANAPSLYAQADDETRPWREFVLAWWDTHGNRTVGVKALFKLAARDNLLLDVLGGGGERSRRTILGQVLRGMRDRVIAGYRIVSVGEDNRGRQQYRFEPVTAKPTLSDLGPAVGNKVGNEQPQSDADLSDDADLCRPSEGSTVEEVEQDQNIWGGERSAEVCNAVEHLARMSVSSADLPHDLAPTSPTSAASRDPVPTSNKERG
jgi:putative DNA primase/helicase